MDKFSNHEQKQGGVFIKSEGKIKGAKITDNLISPGTTLLEADEIENTSIERNKNLSTDIRKIEIKDNKNGKKNLYEQVLGFAYSKHEIGFQFDELKNSLNLNQTQVDWVLETFLKFGEELIAISPSKKQHTYVITAKGISAYLTLKQNSKTNIGEMIGEMEVIYGDKIGRDKIQQHGDRNKAQIKNIQNINPSKWFSMDNPIIWIIASLIVVAVGYYFLSR